MYWKIPVPFLTGLLTLVPAAVSAQSGEQPASGLQQIRDTLEQLDGMAAACVFDSLNTDSCTPFLNAVNGDLLTAYIETCASVRNWRDEFVADQVEEQSSAGAGVDAGTFLRYLVEIEYLCGKAALSRATRYVVPAYRGTSTATGSTANLQYQLDSLRQRQLLTDERERQRRALFSQQQRGQQQTTRQFEQLQLELLRQQSLPQYPR